jgi:uncharacterized cupredoxin-like copper-binding protein
MKVLVQVTCAAALVMSFAGCAEDPNDTLGASSNSSDTAADGSTLIIASVREWKVAANRISVSAGPTTFLVSNLGTIKHEFLLTKTDFANGQIPIDSKLNRFSEEGKGVKVVNEISEWAPLTTQLLTFNLAPGNYQLLCNLPGHYGNGMHTELTVK